MLTQYCIRIIVQALINDYNQGKQPYIHLNRALNGLILASGSYASLTLDTMEGFKELTIDWYRHTATFN